MERCILLLFALFLQISPVTAQDNAQITNFSIYEIQGKAYLYWVISAGTSCNGIGIQRSDDGIGFTEISSIAGICGQVSSSAAYEFTDNNPIFNKPVYYRLRLGLGGYSPAVSIQIMSVGASGVLMVPNPASDFMTMYFINENRINATIEIYNSQGAAVQRLQTRDSKIELNLTAFPAGVYSFRIISDAVLKSQFIVAR